MDINRNPLDLRVVKSFGKEMQLHSMEQDPVQVIGQAQLKSQLSCNTYNLSPLKEVCQQINFKTTSQHQQQKQQYANETCLKLSLSQQNKQRFQFIQIKQLDGDQFELIKKQQLQNIKLAQENCELKKQNYNLILHNQLSKIINFQTENTQQKTIKSSNDHIQKTLGNYNLMQDKTKAINLNSGLKTNLIGKQYIEQSHDQNFAPSQNHESQCLAVSQNQQSTSVNLFVTEAFKDTFYESKVSELSKSLVNIQDQVQNILCSQQITEVLCVQSNVAPQQKIISKTNTSPVKSKLSNAITSLLNITNALCKEPAAIFHNDQVPTISKFVPLVSQMQQFQHATGQTQNINTQTSQNHILSQLQSEIREDTQSKNQSFEQLLSVEKSKICSLECQNADLKEQLQNCIIFYEKKIEQLGKLQKENFDTSEKETRQARVEPAVIMSNPGNLETITVDYLKLQVSNLKEVNNAKRSNEIIQQLMCEDLKSKCEGYRNENERLAAKLKDQQQILDNHNQQLPDFNQSKQNDLLTQDLKCQFADLAKVIETLQFELFEKVVKIEQKVQRITQLASFQITKRSEKEKYVGEGADSCPLEVPKCGLTVKNDQEKQTKNRKSKPTVVEGSKKQAEGTKQMKIEIMTQQEVSLFEQIEQDKVQEYNQNIERIHEFGQTNPVQVTRKGDRQVQIEMMTQYNVVQQEKDQNQKSSVERDYGQMLPCQTNTVDIAQTDQQFTTFRCQQSDTQVVKLINEISPLQRNKIQTFEASLNQQAQIENQEQSKLKVISPTFNMQDNLAPDIRFTQLAQPLHYYNTSENCVSFQSKSYIVNHQLAWQSDVDQQQSQILNVHYPANTNKQQLVVNNQKELDSRNLCETINIQKSIIAQLEFQAVEAEKKLNSIIDFSQRMMYEKATNEQKLTDLSEAAKIIYYNFLIREDAIAELEHEIQMLADEKSQLSASIVSIVGRRGVIIKK